MKDELLIIYKLDARSWLGFSHLRGKLRFFGGSKLLTFSVYDVILSGNKAYRLKEYKLKRSFYRITRKYGRFKWASLAMKHIDTLPYEVPFANLYTHTLNFLKNVERYEYGYDKLFLLWLYHYLKEIGQDVIRCNVCASEEVAYLKNARAYCSSCSKKGVALDSVEREFLKHLDRFDYDTIVQVKLDVCKILRELSPWVSCS